jgi:hypothetical protein
MKPLSTPVQPSLQRAKRLSACWLAPIVVTVLLAACAGKPPPPDWQLNAKGSLERAASAYLRGDSRIEAAEFSRARAEVASTARTDWLARAELYRCAMRVASLDFEPCSAYEALAADAAPPEQAYARYLAGQASAADAALLPGAHQNPSDASLPGIEDPLSRLVAAGVLFRSSRATPQTITQAIDTASAQGWRRPLLAWLKVAQQRAQSAGAADEAARLQRRIDLLVTESTKR